MSSSGGGDSLSEQHLSVDMCAQDVSSKIGVVERERASICWGCIIILDQLNLWLQRVLVVCLCYCLID